MAHPSPKGLTFRMFGSKAGGARDLDQLLARVGDRYPNIEWLVGETEVAGEPSAAKRFDEEINKRTRIPQLRMVPVAKGVQLIDGELSGYLPNSDDSVVTIRAVDSTYWDVISPDDALLETLRAWAPDATELPD
jgi:hypothetical protein